MPISVVCGGEQSWTGRVTAGLVRLVEPAAFLVLLTTDFSDPACLVAGPNPSDIALVLLDYCATPQPIGTFIWVIGSVLVCAFVILGLRKVFYNVKAGRSFRHLAFCRKEFPFLVITNYHFGGGDFVTGKFAALTRIS